MRPLLRVAPRLALVPAVAPAAVPLAPPLLLVALGILALLGVAAYLAYLQEQYKQTIGGGKIPGIGELDPTNWGGANGNSPPSMLPQQEPSWWPKGSIANVGETTVNYDVTATYLSGNGIPYTSTLHRDLDVQDLGQIDVVGTGNGYKMFNVKSNGARVEVDQMSGSSISGVTVSQVVVGPRIPGAPSTPYQPFTPSQPSTGTRPGGFVPSPEPVPQEVPNPLRPATRPQRRTIPLPLPLVNPQQPGQAPQPGQNPDPSPRPLPLPPVLPEPLPEGLPFPKIPTFPQFPPLPQELPKPIPPTPLPKTPIRPDSTPEPQPVPNPPPWPPGLEVPWPGADPIGQTGSQPRPDLVSLARELGRLEQKTAQIGAGKGGPDLGSIIDLIKKIIGEGDPSQTYPAGSYQLRRVCEVDANGDPLPPLEAAWNAGTGKLQEVEAKLDALAELLQHHKDIKQPICEKPRFALAGDWVTVHFQGVGD